MEYKPQIKYASSKLYADKVCQEESKPKKANLGGLEMKQFKEIEGWLFDCGSGR